MSREVHFGFNVVTARVMVRHYHIWALFSLWSTAHSSRLGNLIVLGGKTMDSIIRSWIMFSILPKTVGTISSSGRGTSLKRNTPIRLEVSEEGSSKIQSIYTIIIFLGIRMLMMLVESTRLITQPARTKDSMF